MENQKKEGRTTGDKHQLHQQFCEGSKIHPFLRNEGSI